MFKLFILALLSIVFSFKANAEDCNSLPQCAQPTDIPPTNVPWNCVGPLEITYTCEDGVTTCQICVSFCYRQPYVTAPHYDIYLCSIQAPKDCCNGELLSYSTPKRWRLILEAIIHENPNNVFSNIPNCPSTVSTISAYFSRCFTPEGQMCSDSEAYCKKTYQTCKNPDGKIQRILINEETIGVVNCTGNCVPTYCED